MIIPPDEVASNPSSGGHDTAKAVQYHAPPPSYPPIVGNAARQRGETNNLFPKFLDMSLGDALRLREEEGRYGVVLDSVEQLCNYITQSHYPFRARTMIIRYREIRFTTSTKRLHTSTASTASPEISPE